MIDYNIDLLSVFYILSLANSAHASYTFIHAHVIISKWNPLIAYLNDSLDQISDDEIDDFESDAKSTPLISGLIKKIKSITSKSSDLSVNEIQEVIDDDIMNWENRLNSSSNIFILLGVFFTVYSLFLALPENIDTDTIENLLSNFRVAFKTTVIGLVLASVVRAAQFSVRKKREDFRYNFLLLVKTILVPRYSVPEVDEKNLGELVRSISKSAKELEKAAKSVEHLSSQTRIGTENIERAVDGFSDVTEKMSQREETLNRSLSNLSSYLNEIQNSLDGTITTLSDNILHHLKDNEVKNTSYLDSIKEVRDKQIEINKNIQSTLGKISNSNEKLGSFFGDEFREHFKTSMEELNKSYNRKLNEISTQVQDLENKISEKLSNDLFQEDINDLVNRMEENFSNIQENITSISAPIHEFGNLLSKIDSDSNSSAELVNDIQNSTNNIDQTVRDIHNIVYSIQSSTSNSDLEIIKNSLSDTRENLRTLIESLGNVKSDLSNIGKKINDLPITERKGILKGFTNIFSSVQSEK